MPFDFDTFLDRRGCDCLAMDKIPYGPDYTVDEGFDIIPMWIADMSFPVADCVQKAMYKRMETPNYGYFAEPDEYFNAIIYWHKIRKGVEDIKKEHIGYENGVLGGVASAIATFTAPGDKILVHSPTYVGFTSTIGALGRPIVHSPLKKDSDGVWRMDFEDMDAKIKENNIHMAVFCSPQNPTGRVWEKWEIEKAMEIYKENDCLVISDEIWSDIIMPGHKHVTTQSVSEDAKMRTMAFYAPSKTFSLAGLVGSYHIIYNSYLRDRISKQALMSHYNDMNVISMHALLGAYSKEGNEWTSKMIETINKNLNFACDFIHEKFEGVEVMHPQGTYMLYLDCSKWLKAHSIDIHELQKRGVRCGVIWQDGESFIWPDTIRMNFALPFEKAKEAMERLEKYAFV